MTIDPQTLDPVRHEAYSMWLVSIATTLGEDGEPPDLDAAQHLISTIETVDDVDAYVGPFIATAEQVVARRDERVSPTEPVD